MVWGVVKEKQGDVVAKNDVIYEGERMDSEVRRGGVRGFDGFS